MKQAISILSLFILNTSFSHTEYKIDEFCQDLNTILQRVQTHANNIANHKTTRTIEGGYYKRRIISSCKNGHCQIKIENAQPILTYHPNHPDANQNGYVAYPNFSIHAEKAHLIKAQNAYDLVVGNMPVNSIDFIKGNRFDHCFDNYSYFKDQFDFQTYLGRK